MPSLTPHPVDLHVGARIRLRRQILKLSQSTLADALGLTFQQVQKYERGANRISASMLHRASIALRIAPAWFFEGLPPTSPSSAPLPANAKALEALGRCPEAAALARALCDLPKPVQRNVLALMRDLADDAG